MGIWRRLLLRRNKYSQSSLSLKINRAQRVTLSEKSACRRKSDISSALLHIWQHRPLILPICAVFLNYAFVPHKQMCNSHSPCPVLFLGVEFITGLCCLEMLLVIHWPFAVTDLECWKPVLPGRLTERQADRGRITELFYSGCGSLILIVVYVV